MTKPTHNAPVPPGVQPALKSERIGRRLTGKQLDIRLSGLPGWEAVDGEAALRRTFELPTLRAALAFLTYVVEIAEALDRRPVVGEP